MTLLKSLKRNNHAQVELGSLLLKWDSRLRSIDIYEKFGCGSIKLIAYISNPSLEDSWTLHTYNIQEQNYEKYEKYPSDYVSSKDLNWIVEFYYEEWLKLKF